MEKLEFSTGLKQFELKNGQVLTFNPTDPFFVKKLYGAIESLEAIQEEYGKFDMQSQDAKAIFAFIDNIDEKMQKVLDDVFGVVIERDAFDYVSLFSIDDGLPLWANFIFSVIDKMDVGITKAQKAQNPRLQKLMSKYKRK